MKPTILAITPGEPAGIGPDLTVMVAQHNSSHCLVAIADPQILKERAALLNLNVNLTEFDGSSARAGNLQVIPVSCSAKATAGSLNIANSHYVLKTLTIAAQGCIDQRFDALVTGPLQKSIINEAGVRFSGHTEFLAEHCGGCLPVMMLANQKLKVCLVTTHIPLLKVSQAITYDRVSKVIEITHTDLVHKFGITNPRIAICGLNPHAGENGHLGTEEIDVIEPVVSNLKSKGLNLLGPLPADTAFTPKILDQVDAVISMFHDQGLPVVKALGFGETVNITLGLPIIRTSVDHGTAIDLAGTGQIQTSSFLAAINAAADMAAHQTNQ